MRKKARTALGGDLDGVLREFGTFDENGLVCIPDHFSYEEAATLPCAAVTAYHALFESGRMKSDDSVLLQGTGGVSIFALQFAAALGTRIIITSSSDEKLERAKELGRDGFDKLQKARRLGQSRFGIDRKNAALTTSSKSAARERLRNL